MPIPIAIYYIGAGIATGAGAAYLVKNADGTLEEIGEAAAQTLIDEGVPFLETVGNELLDVIEGAGEAVVKGLDRTFNYIADRFIRGKEPDIVAGFTVVILTIGAAVYLYNSVKNANDAF